MIIRAGTGRGTVAERRRRCAVPYSSTYLPGSIQSTSYLPGHVVYRVASIQSH